MQCRLPRIHKIERLPEIGTALNDMSWADIRRISDAGLASSYFNVGDRKSVMLSGTACSLSLNGTYYCYIIGIDHNSAIEGANRIHFQFGFDAKDADRLAQLASATKGKTQTFFQVEHATTSYKEDDDNTRHTVTEKEHVRIQDVIDFLNSFHGVAIANKQQLELEKAQKEHDNNLPDYQV